MTSEGTVPRSFRDPGGIVFVRDGIVLRRIHRSYAEHYDRLMGSGLYEALVRAGLLIPHQEEARSESPDAHRILKPEQIPFLSYSHEWCFSELKDAALAALRAQRLALEKGMTLKDAPSSNWQFLRGRPTLIDTLSFENWSEGRPWAAYRQFCQNFLAPLAIRSMRDARLGRLSASFPDGIPLDLASRLLPWTSRLKPSLAFHLHIHARAQQLDGRSAADKPSAGFSRAAFHGLVDNLEAALESLQPPREKSHWSAYYQTGPYDEESLAIKGRIVRTWLEKLKPPMVWDLGSNIGRFSRLAPEGSLVVALESAHACVEELYRTCRSEQLDGILPLVQDLCQPSPAMGWENKDTLSLEQRGPADAALALALTHHLACSHNLTFTRQACFFSRVCRSLIVEFIPKSDPMAQRLLSGREDIYPWYTPEEFERAFAELFRVEDRLPIGSTGRVLYHLSRRS